MIDDFLDREPGSVRRRFADRLRDDEPLLAVELRPPRRDLAGVRAMDAWIDVYHAVRRLGAADTAVFLTDNAIGSAEEENLGHLVKNLGADAPRDRIVPFLTLKHPLSYCERFIARARAERFPGLVVLGGDRHDGVPRCLEHAWELRARARREQPGLVLGGWVNPYRDPEGQVSFLLDHASSVDFALTQIVSHHDLAPVEAFVDHAAKRGLDLPLFAGVFFYRSASRKTLDGLANFIPVPRAALVDDFEQRKLAAEEIAATTVRALVRIGFRRFYISNLETSRAALALSSIARAAGLADPLVEPPRARGSSPRR